MSKTIATSSLHSLGRAHWILYLPYGLLLFLLALIAPFLFLSDDPLAWIAALLGIGSLMYFAGDWTKTRTLLCHLILSVEDEQGRLTGYAVAGALENIEAKQFRRVNTSERRLLARFLPRGSRIWKVACDDHVFYLSDNMAHFSDLQSRLVLTSDL